MEWYEKIEPQMITYLETQLHKEYPDLHCTTLIQNYITETETQVNGKFPTLYMYNTFQEIGNDLHNITINGVRCTSEIRIYHNTSKYECAGVATAALKQMKSLCFNVPKMPLTTPYKNIFLSVFVCRRDIGGADKLII